MRHIEESLNVYGQRPQWKRAYCPVCDELRETVFFRIDGEMICRKHEGHPLYEAGPGSGHDAAQGKQAENRNPARTS